MTSLHPKMLVDPLYWKKAVHRVGRRLRQKWHLESLLPDAIEVLYDPTTPEPAGGRRRVLCATMQFDYGDPARGFSYEENNFLDTFVAMGHQVIRFDFPTILQRHGRQKMNDLLVEAVYRTRPHVAFFSLFKDEFREEALDEIRVAGRTKTCNWFSDDHWRFDSFSRRWAPHFDAVVTTYSERVSDYAALGVRAIESQWAVNPALYYDFHGPRDVPATFIGQPYGDRAAAVGKVRSAGIPVEAWGYGWPNGKLSQWGMVKLLNRSQVSINFSSSSRPGSRQIKGRTFEIPACGALMATDPAPGLERYFEPGEEILVFDDADDLTRVLRKALTDPSRLAVMAARARDRCLREHTYHHRFKALLQALET